MKRFFYALTFLASVGTIGVVATNPQLVQQGASFIGVSPSASPDDAVESEDDHLAKFLSQYPYAGKDDTAVSKGETPTPDSRPSVVPKVPPIPPAPPKPPLPKDPFSNPEPPNPEPPKVATAPVADSFPPELPKLEPKPPKEDPFKTELPMLADTKPAPALPPIVVPRKETPKPETVKEDTPKLPSLPLIAPIVVKETKKETSAPMAPHPPVSAPQPDPMASVATDPFSTTEFFPVVSNDTPAEEPVGMASTRKSEPEPEAGFASTRSSVYGSGHLTDHLTDHLTGHLVEPETSPVVAAPPMIEPPKVEPPLPAPPMERPVPVVHEHVEAIPPQTPAKPSPPPVVPVSDPFLVANRTAPVVPAPPQQNLPQMVASQMAAPVTAMMPPPGPPQMAAQGVPPNMLPMSAHLPQHPAVPAMSQPQASHPKASSQFQVNPSIVAEEIPCHGSEIVARVGREVIMMCDVLPQLRRAGMQVIREQMKKMSPEERAQVPQEETEQFVDMVVESQYPSFLENQIRVALVYNDFFVSKNKEEREMFEKKFAEEFDQKEVPEMIKEFGVRDIAELKQFLNAKLGTSIDKERRIWIRNVISEQWVYFNTQGATGECTHDEMMEYYTENKSAFTSKTRAQWQELFVAFSNHKTERDAYMKAAWMGNQVAAGFTLEDIAKKNSDGFTAAKGGLWDWTFRGSLASQELEDAVFTQPVGVLSPKIIRTDKGFHLIRVTKRDEAKTTPYIEAQVIIREKIRQQRRMKLEREYFEDLNRRYPTIVLKEKIDFDLNRRTANVFGGRK